MFLECAADGVIKNCNFYVNPTFSNGPLRYQLIKLQILNLLSFVINVCWETPQSGEIKSSYLFVSSHFFYKVDILDFFADNIYGD